MTTVLRRLGCSLLRRFRIERPVLVLSPSSTTPTNDGDECELVPSATAAVYESVTTTRQEQHRKFLQNEIRQGHSRSSSTATPLLGSNQLLANHLASAAAAAAAREWRSPFGSQHPRPESRGQHQFVPSSDSPMRTLSDARYLPQ